MIQNIDCNNCHKDYCECYKRKRDLNKQIGIERTYKKIIKTIERFDGKIIENKNNILLFSIGDKTFYYGLASRKIRVKGGTLKWNTKIIATIIENIPKR